MSWYIGKVALPRGPARAVVKQGMDALSLRMMSQKPNIISFGPKTRVLSLEGIIADHTKTITEIETLYLKPLKDMASKVMGFSYVVYDDDETIWAADGMGSDTNRVIISEETSEVQKGSSSLKVELSTTGGTKASPFIWTQPAWDPKKDFSTSDFWTVWWYGTNSGKKMNFLLKTAGADWRSWDVFDTWTGWSRIFLWMDEYDIEGGSFDLSQIAWVQIDFPSAEMTNRIHYLDRTVLGIGQLIQTPHSLYDGIYFVQMFAYNEVERETNRFTYKLELWCQDDNF